MSASASRTNGSPDASVPLSSADSAFSSESIPEQDPPTREEMVAVLEDLADRVRHDNINVRLVLTALAAAIHTGEERDLSRHVAAFDPTRRTSTVQNRLLQDALRIINGR
jgi:hypothetical protein